MNRKPDISIIMPAYNAAEFIEQAVDSILKQTVTNFELLICDDGSTDATWEKLHSYKDPRIRLLKNDNNLGNVETTNRLFVEAQGRYIAIQDADDWSAPNRIELQFRHLENNTRLSACYTQMCKVDVKGNLLWRSRFPTSDRGIKCAMPHHFQILCASILFRRNILNEIGNYQEYFSGVGGADWYWTYLLFERFQAENLEETLYYYRANPNSLTHSKSIDYKSYYIIRILHYLISQRKRYGADGLSHSQLKNDLRTFESKLKAKHNADPILYEKLDYARARSEGRKKKAMSVLLHMIDRAPVESIAWMAERLHYKLIRNLKIAMSRLAIMV